MANEAAEQLSNEITAVIDRFREESDLDFLDIIGALEINKLEITMEMMGLDGGDEDEDSEGEGWKPPNYKPL